MDRKRTRSRSGTAGFSASDMTRQLNASQLSSRLKNRPGPVISAAVRATGSGKVDFRKSAFVMAGFLLLGSVVGLGG